MVGEFLFTRFTERARQAVVMAQDEARSQNLDYIGSEHLLLGLLREEDGLGSIVMQGLGIGLDEARAKVLDVSPSGDEKHEGQLPLTPHANKVCKLALLEALSLGHNYVGTEHQLLGLIQDARPSPNNVPRRKTGYAIDTPASRIFPDDATSVVGEVFESFRVDLDDTYDLLTKGLLRQDSRLWEIVGERRSLR